MENFKIGDTAIYIPNSEVGEPKILLECNIGIIVNIDANYIHLKYNKSGYIHCILPEGIKHYPLLNEVKRGIYITI